MNRSWADILMSIAWVVLGIVLIYVDLHSRPYTAIGGATFLGLTMIVYGVVPAKEE